MTALELYDATLIELNKVNAPTFTIEQWNYFINKAIQSYTDKRYNFYAVNQQLTDDLRVLLSTYRSFNPANTNVDTEQEVEYFQIVDAEGKLIVDELYVGDSTQFIVGDHIMIEGFNTKIYTITETNLSPNAFFPEWDTIKITPHIFFGFGSGGGGGGGAATFGLKPGAASSISADGDTPEEIARKLLKSKIYKVYNSYQTDKSLSNNTIHSFNLETGNYYHTLAVRTYWTDSRVPETKKGHYCDYNKVRAISKMYPAKRLTYDMLANIENNAYLKPSYRQPYHLLQDNKLNLGTEKINDATGEFQNSPLVEVHVGKIPAGLNLEMVEVDYLKLPEVVEITDKEVYLDTTDKSQLLEWPDYLNSEIVKQVVSYFLENATDPRIQSFTTFQQDTPAAPLEFGAQ